ncbi:MAG: outer membrane protein transport protein [bacterium]
MKTQRLCHLILYWTWLFLGILGLNLSSAHAQRPPVVPINLSYFRVDFIQPGARPAALGGAFIGAAQDETAAPINPAGLIYLKSAGASLHQRVANFDFDEPQGSPASPNNKRSFGSHNFDQNLAVVFFPIKRFTFAIFRQVAIDTRFIFETQQFLTNDTPLTTQRLLGGLGNFPGRRVNLSLKLVNDGLAIGYRLNKRLSLGISSKISVLKMGLDEQTFLDPLLTDSATPRGNLPETTYSVSIIDERVTDPSFSIGMMSKIILDKLFVGAVAHFNPSFGLNNSIFLPQYSTTEQTFPAKSVNPSGFKFSVPNSYGFGLYFVPKSRLRFTFDLVRIQYSDMLEGNNLNIVADDVVDAATGQYLDPDGLPDLTVDDVNEFHAGVEFLVKMPRIRFLSQGGLIPIRVGLHTNPGHRIYSISDNPDLRRLFPKAKDRMHFTFGSGFVLNSYLKFDGSVTFSEETFEFYGSALITIPL